MTPFRIIRLSSRRPLCENDGMSARRVARRLAVTAGVLSLAAAFAVAPSPRAASATFTLESYDALAQSAGIRIQVVKPAALPTSDELATLAIPFSHAEASSSPLGRGIGSWLWPGETAADAKSLALVGLDPGADETACAERESGTGRPRTLATIPNPTGGGDIAVADPSDNPCGSASFKQVFAGQIERDPNSPQHGRRTGGLIRSMPDYPFWAVAQYPSAVGQDSQRKVLCQAPGAMPAEPWHTPRDVCPPGGAPDAGLSAASASASRSSAQSSLANLSLAVIRAESVEATSSVAFVGAVLVSSSVVRFTDLSIAGDAAAPLLRIGSLVATATASSDGALTGGSLLFSGVRAALPGLPPGLPCSAARPCAATIGRDGVRVADAAVPAVIAAAVAQAMDMLAIRVAPHAIGAAGQTASAGADASGPGVLVARDRRSVDVAGLHVGLAADDSVQGRSIVTMRIAGASATAVAAPSRPAGDIGEVGGIDAGPADVPDGTDALPEFAAPAPPGMPPAAAVQPPLSSRIVAAPTLPPSQPIPPALALLALAVVLAGAAGMVAFGIWESSP